MAQPSMTRGIVMTGAGIVMILAAAAIMLATRDSLPIALAGVGVVFVAIGGRERREAAPPG